MFNTKQLLLVNGLLWPLLFLFFCVQCRAANISVFSLRTGATYAIVQNHSPYSIYYATDSITNTYGILPTNSSVTVWPTNAVYLSAASLSWSVVANSSFGTNNVVIDVVSYPGSATGIGALVSIPPTTPTPLDQQSTMFIAGQVELTQNQSLAAWFFGGFGIGFACAVSGLIWNTFYKGIRGQAGFYD